MLKLMYVTFLSNLQSIAHPSFLFEKMGGFFFRKFAFTIPLLILVLKLLPHLLLPYEKVCGAFF
jgi:hypothetical protein